MTRRLPSLKARQVKARQVMRALERAGFVHVHSKCSHRIYQHRDDARRRTVVADRGGKDVPRSTLDAIIDQAGLTVDEFINLP
jgi:predicted RNA binding protein YcfA (HicA-like mRNA interferase family)